MHVKTRFRFHARVLLVHNTSVHMWDLMQKLKLVYIPEFFSSIYIILYMPSHLLSSLGS